MATRIKTKAACTTEPFKLVSTEKAEPPSGSPSGNWYRYEISQGTTTIVGHRQGSKRAVTAAIREEVARLNERRLGKARA